MASRSLRRRTWGAEGILASDRRTHIASIITGGKRERMQVNVNIREFCTHGFFFSLCMNCEEKAILCSRREK